MPLNGPPELQGANFLMLNKAIRKECLLHLTENVEHRLRLGSFYQCNHAVTFLKDVIPIEHMRRCVVTVANKLDAPEKQFSQLEVLLKTLIKARWARVELSRESVSVPDNTFLNTIWSKETLESMKMLQILDVGSMTGPTWINYWQCVIRRCKGNAGMEEREMWRSWDGFEEDDEEGDEEDAEQGFKEDDVASYNMEYPADGWEPFVPA